MKLKTKGGSHKGKRGGEPVSLNFPQLKSSSIKPQEQKGIVKIEGQRKDAYQKKIRGKKRKERDPNGKEATGYYTRSSTKKRKNRFFGGKGEGKCQER